MTIKSVTILSVAALSSVVSMQTQAGATLTRIKQNHELVAVMDKSYPPFVFLNASNQLDGFDVDVVKEVARRLKAKVRIETPAWEATIAGHWNGRWDVCICSMTPDEQKARVLDFPIRYYSSPAVVVVNATNTRIKGGKDLQGKQVGVEQASSYERYLNKGLKLYGDNTAQPTYPFSSVTVHPYESEELAFQDLALGDGKRIDAVVSNLVAAKPRLAKYPGKFKIVGHPLYGEPNWVAIDKGDAEWGATLRKIITDMRHDGTLARISKRWVGSDITQ
jgi:polar amino acid transport system substrate-binding protein